MMFVTHPTVSLADDFFVRFVDCVITGPWYTLIYAVLCIGKKEHVQFFFARRGTSRVRKAGSWRRPKLNTPLPAHAFSCPQYGLGEDVYDDDRAAAEKKSRGSEPANGPRVMSGTVQTVVTDRSKM